MEPHAGTAIRTVTFTYNITTGENAFRKAEDDGDGDMPKIL